MGDLMRYPQIVTRQEREFDLDMPAAASWRRNTWAPPVFDTPIVDPVEYSVVSPVRSPSWGADVLVPFGQSLFTALFVGLCVGTLAVWCRWTWRIPVTVAAVAAVLVWFVTLVDTRQLLRKVESVIGRDLDRDGHVGPQQHATSFTVRLEEPGKFARDLFLQFDGVQPVQLNELFVGALRGDSLAESGWTGEGRLFSKPKFIMVRDALIKADLLAWVNVAAHAQGLGLTRSGRPVLQRWVDEYARTQAHAGDDVENQV